MMSHPLVFWVIASGYLWGNPRVTPKPWHTRVPALYSSKQHCACACSRIISTLYHAANSWCYCQLETTWGAWLLCCSCCAFAALCSRRTLCTSSDRRRWTAATRLTVIWMRRSPAHMCWLQSEWTHGTAIDKIIRYLCTEHYQIHLWWCCRVMRCVECQSWMIRHKKWTGGFYGLCVCVFSGILWLSLSSECE